MWFIASSWYRRACGVCSALAKFKVRYRLIVSDRLRSANNPSGGYTHRGNSMASSTKQHGRSRQLTGLNWEWSYWDRTDRRTDRAKRRGGTKVKRSWYRVGTAECVHSFAACILSDAICAQQQQQQKKKLLTINYVYFYAIVLGSLSLSLSLLLLLSLVVPKKRTLRFSYSWSYYYYNDSACCCCCCYRA